MYDAAQRTVFFIPQYYTKRINCEYVAPKFSNKGTGV